MRKLIAALVLALAVPACASALEIRMTEIADQASGSTIAMFSAEADTIDVEPGKETQPDPIQMAITAKIEARFAQLKAFAAMNRGSICQAGSLWQDNGVASMGLVWQGEQADGSHGCTASGLTVNLETGEEILLEQLFADADGALAEMERIIVDDVLDSMSDYMEYAELLPMPTDNFCVNERGLTVYWPEERYRYFDGTSGSVTFYWHELADYIGQASPVYALAHPDTVYGRSEIQTLCFSGELGMIHELELGNPLGFFAEKNRLADPDYTTDALVYPLERERGYAVEIPKYAETPEEETPISAIRASRISFADLLTTGKTTDVDAMKLLGDPAKTVSLDEDAAFDAMLEPGESLYYEIEGNVLQLHFNEDGVLSCVILRDAMPESLY